MINLIPFHSIPITGRGYQLQYHPRYFCLIMPLPLLSQSLYFTKIIPINAGNEPAGDDIKHENIEANSVYGRENSNGVDAL